MPFETVADIERRMQALNGVTVEYQAKQTWGLFDIVDEVAIGDDGQAEVVGAALALKVPTAALAGLARDDAITVDGDPYTIRDHRRIGDGTLTRIWLRE